MFALKVTEERQAGGQYDDQPPEQKKGPTILQKRLERELARLSLHD
jgi:hypothetical protein